MQTKHTQISCPNCNHTVDVHEIVYQQLNTELQSKFDSQLKAEQQKLIDQQAETEAMRQQLTANSQREKYRAEN